MLDQLPQAVRGQEVSVEGLSPAALEAHLICRQEVTELHVLADVPEHGLLDSPCGRSRGEACTVCENPAVPDVLADTLIAASDPDLDCAEYGVVKRVHYGRIEQVETVAGAVAAGPFATPDLAEPRRHLLSAGHVRAPPPVDGAGVWLQWEVARAAHLPFGLIGVSPLFSLRRHVPACDAAASPAPDMSKPWPHLAATPSAPAVPRLVDAAIGLQRPQARGHHVHHSLLGIAQPNSRIGLDPAADASALATADIRARGHSLRATRHAAAPPGPVIAARVRLQRLRAPCPHERCRLCGVGAPGSRAGLDAALLAAAFPRPDLLEPRRHLATAPDTPAPPRNCSVTRIRFQRLQPGSKHVGYGDLCVNGRAAAAVLAAPTRPPPHHVEPGRHLATACHTAAPPWLIVTGIRIKWLNPGRPHDRGRRFVSPSRMPAARFLIGTRRTIAASAAQTTPEIVQVGRHYSTAGHASAPPRQRRSPGVGVQRLKPGLVNHSHSRLVSPPRDMPCRFDGHDL